MRHLTGKSTLAHKCSALNPFALAMPIQQLTVPPQKVAEVNGGVGDPTRDTYQRKVFYDGTNFFIIYWHGGDLKTYYVASSDGKTWTDPVAMFTFSVAPYYGGNVDVCYPNRGSKDVENEDIDLATYLTGSNGATAQWRPYIISGQTLTLKAGRGASGLIGAQGGSVLSNLSGEQDFAIYHQTHGLETGIGLHGSSVYGTTDNDQSVPYGGTTTGGAQILPYKTSSPFNMLALAKGADNKLYYNIAIETTRLFQNGFTAIATLGTGFSDFCAASEAQNIGDPEIIDIVYIKSTGELAHKSFLNDELTSETILCESGASYPVIACGKGGRRYLYYVKDGVIKQQKLRNLNGVIQVLTPEATLFPEHTYNNPAYLSTNQNVQNGQICLVWTEGTASPYEVWFCTIGD